VQVGTSPYSLVSKGTDYAFISALTAESPRIAPSLDLPADRQCPEPCPVGLSRYGVMPQGAEDFPRHYPPTLLAGEGFAVMSGSARGVTSARGSCVYPTRNFALVSPHVAMGLGPSLRLSVGTEPAGVWPLKIPGTEFFSDLSPTMRRR
jgi:hypothetical protein